jgi:AcrR family transcriptional regulator
MARPNRTRERREELLPIVARSFAELGYRRTTTAALARRCGVQETILYRLWPDKKAMFLASIRYVYALSEQFWTSHLRSSSGGSAAERILAYEAEHHGETGLYRILFAGLAETDDPEIHADLRVMYRRYQKWIRRQIEDHRRRRGVDRALDAELAAWAVVGLGTIANVGRELRLFPGERRNRLIADVGRVLLEGRSS